MKHRTSCSFILGGLLAAAQPFGTAAVAQTLHHASEALPQVIGPIAVTPTSRPFLGAGDRLDAIGYVEEEYFLSGKARTYDWVGDSLQVKALTAPSRYVTRILVRRPKDVSRFSGNVEVMVLNASGAMDVGSAIDIKRMAEQGDVWIGITSKALTAKALKRFDPVRYAPIDWSNPEPVASRCAEPSIIPAYMLGGQQVVTMMAKYGLEASAPATEDGLVWDMLGQLGLLLKSEQRHVILPGFGKPWIFMTGASQSSVLMRTWIAGFHDRYRTRDGHPVYDGYLRIVGPAMLRINQCARDNALDDPRQKLVPPDVPFISLSSEGEMWQARVTHQPDVFTAHGGIVSYEVAGSSHKRTEVPGLLVDPLINPLPQDAARALPAIPALPLPAAQAGEVPNDLPWAPIVRGAYHNLQLWARKGIRPPQAPGIVIGADHEISRDPYGNALGGLRTPYIDAPTSSHKGYLTAGGAGGIVGSRRPFSDETLKTLYPDHAAYVVKFAAITDRLLAERWISPSDAAAMKAAAQDEHVPR